MVLAPLRVPRLKKRKLYGSHPCAVHKIRPTWNPALGSRQVAGSNLQFLNGVARWLNDEYAIEFYANETSGLVAFRAGSNALARLSEYDLAYLDAVQAFGVFQAFEPLLQDVARTAYEASPGKTLDISRRLVTHQLPADGMPLAVAA